MNTPSERGFLAFFLDESDGPPVNPYPAGSVAAQQWEEGAESCREHTAYCNRMADAAREDYESQDEDEDDQP